MLDRSHAERPIGRYLSDGSNLRISGYAAFFLAKRFLHSYRIKPVKSWSKRDFWFFPLYWTSFSFWKGFIRARRIPENPNGELGILKKDLVIGKFDLKDKLFKLPKGLVVRALRSGNGMDHLEPNRFKIIITAARGICWNTMLPKRNLRIYMGNIIPFVLRNKMDCLLRFRSVSSKKWANVFEWILWRIRQVDL